MAEETDNPSARAGKSKVLIGLLVLNSALLLAVLAVLLLRAEKPPTPAAGASGASEAAQQPAAPSLAPPVTVRLPDFVIRLRNPEADRYARLSFDVEVVSEEDKAAVTARMPQIRDSFIAYLSDRTMEELLGSEAIAAIKETLLKRLSDLVPTAHVRAVYVSDMVLQ